MTRTLFMQLARFAASGVLNTALGLTAIYAVMALGAQYIIANAVGYGIGLVLSFFLNRFWTFQKKSKDAHKDIAPFIATSIVAYLLNLGVVVSLVEIFDVAPAPAQLAGVLAYSVCSFLGLKYFAFASSKSVGH